MFGNLGTVGLAAALTCLLIFGVPGGGKLKPLGWWTTVFVAMLAASSYKAAGGPFTVVPDAAGTVIGFLQGFLKGLTMPALALCVLIFMLFKKLTTKQVGFTALLFFYIATGAGGTWTYVADAIENARVGLQ
ncbi:hypothetical protein [Streptomyces viridochromogenes]|uniref:hypothetical protein n=1 Tax=Streptomyces viridochromogenes TaxID=1938 RepID=UPI00069E024F|nr:hypothetical protein [Streptomyces viridochromogenes]KOG21785.1 hypothetical protein ADK36_12470 [Streptomyces viridochromogenes]